jgi:hypothetical protein
MVCPDRAKAILHGLMRGLLDITMLTVLDCCCYSGSY